MSTYTLCYQPLTKTPRRRTLSKSHRTNSVYTWMGSQPTIASTPISTMSIAKESQNTRFRSQTATTVSTPARSPSISQQESSLFFKLPAELRNTIYKELLCPNSLSKKEMKERSADHSTYGFNQTSTTTRLYPSILSTCKRIAAEAQPLLYTTSTFHAHPSLLTSLPHLTSAAKPVLYSKLTKQIRRWQISLRLDTDPRFSYEDVKRAFSGAEYLEIRVWQAQFEACDFAVLKLFAGVRGVGVAKVGGSVNGELARWLENIMMSSETEGSSLGCTCDVESDCWKGKSEVLCGRCYRKVGCGSWEENEWEVGPPGL